MGIWEKKTCYGGNSSIGSIVQLLATILRNVLHKYWCGYRKILARKILTVSNAGC